MTDHEVTVQFMLGREQQGRSIGAGTVQHPMRGESEIGCAHRPHVELLHVADVGQVQYPLPYGLQIHAPGHAAETQAQAQAQRVPGTRVTLAG